MVPGEHRDWLARRLAQDQPHLWIGVEDGAPVGQVRLDLNGAAAEVSIAVAPGARGRGLGHAILEELKRLAIEDPGIERLVALVHPDNAASMRLFEACGFEPAGMDGAMRRLAWAAVRSEASSSDP